MASKAPKSFYEIIDAASRGSLEQLKAFHASGVDLHKADYDKRTPLHLAASEGHIETVKFLVEETKADVSARDRWGGTPLSDATQNKHVNVAKFLIRHGATAGIKQSLPEFLNAAGAGDLETVKALAAGSVDVNASDYDSRTALHLAASTGQHNVVEYLIQNGAFVNVSDRWGNTPLQDAIRGQHKKVQELITQSGVLQKENIKQIKGTPKFWANLQELVVLMCEKHGFPYGAIWITGDDNELRCPGLWYAFTDQLNSLAEYHSKVRTTLAFGEGAVGKCIKEGKELWIFDKNEIDVLTKAELQSESSYLLPFTCILCIPLVYGNHTLAVLEFRDMATMRNESVEVLASIQESARITITDTMLSSVDATSVLGHGHSDQLKIVYNLVLRDGTYGPALVEKEVQYFFNELGFPDYYFVFNSPQTIAKHITALITGKQYGKMTGSPSNVRFRHQEGDHALYITSEDNMLEVERAIESRYLGEGYTAGKSKQKKDNKATAVRFFLSKKTVDGHPDSTHVGLYMVERHAYLHPDAGENETSLVKIATGAFLRDKGTTSKHYYEEAIKSAIHKMHPCITEAESGHIHPGTRVVTVAFHAGHTHSLYSSLSVLMKLCNVQARSKFVENFSNGMTVYMIYVEGTKEDIKTFVNKVNLVFILPRTSLFPLLEDGRLNLEESVYAYAGWKFSYHFLTKKSDEFTLLWDQLSGDSRYKDRLIRLRKRIRSEAATESRCKEAIFEHCALIKEFYKDFENHFKPRENGEKPPPPVRNTDLEKKVLKSVSNELDRQILLAFLTLNEHMLATNFYKQSKSALSIRLKPTFLSEDHPEVPFAVFLFIGAEFRGFHIRFSDIARGGIRMIRSRNQHMFLRNVEKVVDENYNLAFTQFKKNKDIPEGGSKGTILLSMAHQDKATIAFRKYIDSLLDLMLAESEPQIVNFYDKVEYVFCGPDEGTADLMDWAALHAKSRGYKYWAAFTTGKSTELGGIPHDAYGMTTRSVHQYALGVMRKKGIKEEEQTKLQTGGPDGDLGSNEILIAKDKTTAIVDGSGVLYDPVGIDRQELIRLAKRREMVEHFDKTKLSKDGFLILLPETNVTLPDGTVVDSGFTFRNTFHLTKYAAADFFVPCGGRPESINISNVHQVLTGNNGKPLFKHIIEGANLFLTQEARLKLEEHGIPVLKDASANKGGVTSSSLEVLASLAFVDEEHKKCMCVENGVQPDFYKNYVIEVQNRIENNAKMEFECIWSEHVRTGTPMCVLTDRVSVKINALNQTITSSKLWSDASIKTKVLEEAIPKLLQKELGLTTILERVPNNYIDALLSSHLASRYVYEFGLNPGEFSFYQFMQRDN